MWSCDAFALWPISVQLYAHAGTTNNETFAVFTWFTRGCRAGLRVRQRTNCRTVIETDTPGKPQSPVLTDICLQTVCHHPCCFVQRVFCIKLVDNKDIRTCRSSQRKFPVGTFAPMNESSRVLSLPRTMFQELSFPVVSSLSDHSKGLTFSGH